ncbi:helix-turn-helix transcriptional regulator [Bacillus sp. Marseille-P3661]|uniref:helix-turn-helix transcriptional regulator n=1 Tax=Bacillus sp. Marseille-P3661 TaxID=1936234 RepID=UPI0027E57D2F|nr:helix-turn-helix transcriptional regulator [Bacillus sp. Marseille-P3661]
MLEMECRLKDILKDRGIKQTWLAERIGVRQGTINEIVNGKRLPTLPVAYRIAKELGAHIEDIWRI